MVVYALGELEALCKKACYGAGMAWGVSEEVSKSIAFLCCYDLPAIEALVQILPMQEERASLTLADRRITSDGSLCPIATAIALSDRAFAIDSEAWEVSTLDFPLLLVPILWRASRFHNKIFEFHSDEFGAIIDKSGFALSGDAHVVQVRHGTIKEVQIAPKILEIKRYDSINVEESLQEILLKFFMKTTVPESDESRIKGAGAGLNDND